MDMDMEQTLEECVARGAALLDAHQPGWENRINRGTLVMGSLRQCLLGQLYGDFDTGLDILFPDNDETECLGAHHGFDAHYRLKPLGAQYRRLHTLWCDTIIERRAQ